MQTGSVDVNNAMSIGMQGNAHWAPSFMRGVSCRLMSTDACLHQCKRITISTKLFYKSMSRLLSYARCEQGRMAHMLSWCGRHLEVAPNHTMFMTQLHTIKRLQTTCLQVGITDQQRCTAQKCFNTKPINRKSKHTKLRVKTGSRNAAHFLDRFIGTV